MKAQNDALSTYCVGCPRRGPFLAMARFGLVVRGDVVCHLERSVPPQPVIHICRDLPEGLEVQQAQATAKPNAEGRGGGHPGKHKGGEFRGREVRVISDRDFLRAGLDSPAGRQQDGDGLVTLVFDNGIGAAGDRQDDAKDGGTGDATRSSDPTPTSDIVERCKAAGMGRVVVVDPYSVEEVASALRAALSGEGPSVVVAQAPCVLWYRVRKSVYAVDVDSCTGCKHCLKVGCETLQLVEDAEGGRKAEIVAADCVGCGLCLQLCKKDAISRSEEVAA